MSDSVGFLLSIIAGCMFLASIYAGMIYYRFKDLTEGKTKLVLDPRFFKIVIRENEITRERVDDTSIREQ